jgi:hypothetical protein
MFRRKPTFVPWKSSKTSFEKAEREFFKERGRMEKRGYRLESQQVIEQGRSKKSWATLGIGNILRGKQVQVVATFVRDENAGDEQPERKASSSTPET